MAKESLEGAFVVAAAVSVGWKIHRKAVEQEQVWCRFLSRVGR